jgi:hypothetical protein
VTSKYTTFPNGLQSIISGKKQFSEFPLPRKKRGDQDCESKLEVASIKLKFRKLLAGPTNFVPFFSK